MIYQYTVKKNKFLCYNTTGFFQCPTVIAEEKLAKEKGERYFVDRTKHNEISRIGDNCWHEIERKTEPVPENYIGLEKMVGEEITIVKSLKWKVSRQKPPICHCGQVMVWEGYPVWYTYEDPKAKTIDGMFRMGGKDKTYWTRHFKTKKAREKFINKFLEKHKN